MRMENVMEKEALIRSLAVDRYTSISEYFKDLIVEYVDDALDVVKPKDQIPYGYFLAAATEDGNYYAPDQALYDYVWDRVFQYLQENFNKVAKDLGAAFNKDYSKLDPIEQIEILDYFIRVNGIKTEVYDGICKVLKGIMKCQIELKHDILEGA